MQRPTKLSPTLPTRVPGLQLAETARPTGKPTGRSPPGLRAPVRIDVHAWDPKAQVIREKPLASGHE
jgi:hypothetical protein